MTLNERIAKVLEYSGFTSSEFADAVDVQRSSVSHVMSGRNKPSLEFISKLKAKFPELSWDWLINEQGEMLSPQTPEAPSAEIIENKPVRTPLPDLFSLIQEDDFGIERTTTGKNEGLQEPAAASPTTFETKRSDSQRLETSEIKTEVQPIDKQRIKIKRIVLFFEDGKFEAFEP